MLEITVDASVDQVRQITDLADLQLAETGCSARAKMQIDIAIDEISPGMPTRRDPEQ